MVMEDYNKVFCLTFNVSRPFKLFFLIMATFTELILSV